jgi:hypothetical protein
VTKWLQQAFGQTLQSLEGSFVSYFNDEYIIIHPIISSAVPSKYMHEPFPTAVPANGKIPDISVTSKKAIRNYFRRQASIHASCSWFLAGTADLLGVCLQYSKHAVVGIQANEIATLK